MCVIRWRKDVVGTTEALSPLAFAQWCYGVMHHLPHKQLFLMDLSFKAAYYILLMLRSERQQRRVKKQSASYLSEGDLSIDAWGCQCRGL